MLEPEILKVDTSYKQQEENHQYQRQKKNRISATFTGGLEIRWIFFLKITFHGLYTLTKMRDLKGFRLRAVSAKAAVGEHLYLH
jgi:hypothetical protein